jgi:peptidoglycan L-alanyl-D-glutamate endopeptidase CwlK
VSVYGKTSRARLETCHPVLQVLMHRAMDTCPAGLDWMIVCGHRTKEEQEAAVKGGFSDVHWPNGKHNSLPSKAVDVAPWVRGTVSWFSHDFPPIAKHIKATWETLTEAERGGFTLSWGGDWKRRVDSPHWELR